MKVAIVHTNGTSDSQMVGFQVVPDDSLLGRASAPLAIEPEVRETIIRYLGGHTKTEHDSTCQHDVSLPREHALALLHYLRLTSRPGSADPLDMNWAYLHALENGLGEKP